MKYNSTSTLDGLIQDCETLLAMSDAGISGDATLLKVFTRLINVWYRRVNSAIWDVCGTWEYDDSNYTDLPVATTTLVDSQQDYEIPSTAQKISKVEVLDSSGNYQLLTPFDESMVKDRAMSEFYETAGLPIYYDLKGRSILLYPKPSSSKVTLAAGLKIYFTRDIYEFVSTDTTKEPGFINSFHRLLSLGASYDYAMSYEMLEKANFLKGQINEMISELKRFYGAQHRDMRTRIRPRRQTYL